MKDAILKTKNLSKKFGKIYSINNMNMTIEKGDVYGFVGKNGSGKTTTLRLITSLILPSSGEIYLFGENIKSCGVLIKSRIGAVIENPAFHPNLSAYDNLEFYRIQKGIVDKNIIDKSLEMVNLKDTGKKKYKNFSLGMKQRLGLALAIMNNPDFLILDEPLNGLDPMGIAEFREIIKNLNEEYNMTIILSSHILSELSQVATKFGFINRGHLIKEITQKELLEECNKSLEIKVDNAEKAIFILENKLNTNNFTLLENNEIRLYDYLDNPSEVTFQLNSNGIRVNSIKEIGLNLEDYFIELISNNKLGGI
ncbi:ABC transporter ATP-binding protein [Eubacterium multiforme]|uniref:ABC-2 type transport system ATP-binding protein n=1 Tax=Eubacterium multiforme TaxID=83339 RepID=A0ABT9UUK3_9FIRM|nr:ATP-binding cassette domain-containing protein [Eubacterium multiforme]MDQ0149964.1 ABC-2 type transport system ATP-binding protein [Eubacterium multiforme]